MTRLNWNRARSNPRGYESASPRGASPTPMRGGSHVRPGKVRRTTNTKHEQGEGQNMSSGVNRVIIIGNLGADPEARFTGGGQAVCNMRLAVNESWTDKQGQKQERTEWVPVIVWGKLGELCGEHLKKGRQCYVEGRLQTREYEKDGQKRYMTEVVASVVTFLGGKGEGGQSSRGAPPANSDRYRPAPSDDDIPFN